MNFSEAIVMGLAPDGGLFIPEDFPTLDVQNVQRPADVLKPFFKDDPLLDHLESICEEAFNFDFPLVELDENLSVLELFHGPTSAFKDFGARFLAECMKKLAELQPGLKKTILVATSGDTGGAVASAFHRLDNFDVKILFPYGKVSKRQEQQLTCWDENISSYAVKGDFDHCQQFVKSKIKSQKDLYSSANSINIGRLLPQMVYYALTSIKQNDISYVIPSGNMGNVLACFWAKRIGFPIADIYIATNANKAIIDYYNTGHFEGQTTIPTIANAMDVGHPSNMERFLITCPDLSDVKSYSDAKSFTDNQIEKTIISIEEQYGYTSCPHTATGFAFQRELSGKACVVATAHPAKFDTVIEPIIQKQIKIPPALSGLLERPQSYTIIESPDQL